MDGNAVFSPCRTWRYMLTRRFSEGMACVNFLCLNPSTADETQDDPTVRRCIRFADTWGYGQCVVTNLFAFRATDPRDMFAAVDPVGPENDRWLSSVASKCRLVVAAWGVHGAYLDRGQKVARMLARAGVGLRCMGMTKNGFPRHPLYLRNDVKLIDRKSVV